MSFFGVAFTTLLAAEKVSGVTNRDESFGILVL
jgi:hypothetical protein